PAGSTARRLLCRRPKCKSRYHQNSSLYSFLGPDTVRAPNGSRNVDKSGGFSGRFDDRNPGILDRPWRVVAGPVISANVYHCASLPTDRDTTRRAAAANDWARIRQEIAWSKGDLKLPVLASDQKLIASDQKLIAAHLAEIPADLSIPKFVRRVPEVN